MNPSNEGFIKLSRSFFNNPLWSEERTYSLAEAWLDLIQMARFDVAPQSMVIKMKTITIHRGELRASQRYLAQRWKWSIGKVNRFLKMLENERSLERRNEHSETIIKLCKYELYNPITSEYLNTKMNTNRTLAEHRQIQIKESKERKEDVLLKKEPKYKHNNMGEGNFSEENPQTDKPPNAEPSKKVAKKKVSIPSMEEFTTYALDYIEQKKIKGTREQWKPTIETKYEAWKDAGWKDGYGKPIANWKLKIQSTIPYLKPHYGITNNGNNNYHHASSTQRNAPSTNGVAVSKKISARAILARELAQQNVGNEESRGFGNIP